MSREQSAFDAGQALIPDDFAPLGVQTITELLTSEPDGQEVVPLPWTSSV